MEARTKVSSGNSSMVAEDSPPGYRVTRRVPGPRPRVIVLDENHPPLYEASRELKSIGYRVTTVFEEEPAVEMIIAAMNTHFVLLTAHDTARPLSVPRMIERLRELGYDLPVTCCVRGRVSEAVRAAYEALSVDQVLALPAAQRSPLDALSWIAGKVVFAGGGLTIFET